VLVADRVDVSRLLCVPGLGLDNRAWSPTIRALGGHDGDLVARLPGYGERPTRNDDLRPSSLGARVAEEWLADRSGPIVVMGHSASCQIVAHAAALAGDRVAALVLVGPTTDPRAGSWVRIAERWLRTAVHERPEQLPLLARTYARTGPVWMLRAMDAARREDVRDRLRDVGCPVLVVRGHHDRICPEDWARELVALSPPASRAVTLDRGAHMVPLTHGDMLAAVVRGALDQLGTAGTPE
jgi:pimeloyl-ACP methyl ester carboxylesterase